MIAVSRDDVGKLAACSLSFVPRFDGLIAANGRLYMSTIGGEVICLSHTKGKMLSVAGNIVLTARE